MEDIMEHILSNRINSLSESQTLAMARISRELIAQGKDIISLSIGEPDFATPDFIKEAAKKAIDENYTHYTPVPGYLELRKAISLKFKRDNNLEYSSEQIDKTTMLGGFEAIGLPPDPRKEENYLGKNIDLIIQNSTTLMEQ